MSQQSSVTYTRIGPAPVVRPTDIARFLSRLHDTGFFEFQSYPMRFKLGDRIDRDELPTMYEVPDWVPGVFRIEEIKWDVLIETSTFDDLHQKLEKHDKSIYRAEVLYGSIEDRDFLKVLSREPDAEEPEGMCLWSVFITFGPVTSTNGNVEPGLMGWIGLKFSGNGLYFPWSYTDLLKRIQASEDFRKIEAICQESFPVEPAPPTKRQLKERKGSPMWPYPVDAPNGWYWTFSESW